MSDRSPISARGTLNGDNSALYELLRHVFSAARDSSTGDKFWRFYGSFTDESYVMTEYEAKDGSKIRCDSTGDRDESYRLPNHEFTFRPSLPPDASEEL